VAHQKAQRGPRTKIVAHPCTKALMSFMDDPLTSSKLSPTKAFCFLQLSNQKCCFFFSGFRKRFLRIFCCKKDEDEFGERRKSGEKGKALLKS
jgi:hypothetical protein